MLLRSGVGRYAGTIHPPRTPRGGGGGGGRTVLYPGRRHHLLLRLRISAKKSPEEERAEGDANALSSGVLPGRSALLRAGAVLFALGFVDAGYSGDWSRIGAISRDTEELLKLGAFAVVPLCVALAVLAPGDSGSSES